jgi:transcriptional regulator with XRE-family HTH domain
MARIKEQVYEMGLCNGDKEYNGLYIEKVITNKQGNELGGEEIFRENSGDFVTDYNIISNKFAEYTRQNYINGYIVHEILKESPEVVRLYKKNIEWKEIGRRFKEARLQRKLSLDDVARKLGTSGTRIGKFEKGLPVSCAKMVQQSYQLFLDWTDINKFLEGIGKNINKKDWKERELVSYFGIGKKILNLEDSNI